jgi:mono/diheme cytochrome c family protein
MKSKILLFAISALIIAACSTAKKSTTTSTSESSTTSSTPLVLARTTGMQAPGNEELVAIQAKFSDVTMDKLKQGYELYTNGACINCHTANNIYNYGEAQWKDLVENMAYKARMSDAEKDAVYKYVLSIKATQPTK